MEIPSSLLKLKSPKVIKKLFPPGRVTFRSGEFQFAISRAGSGTYRRYSQLAFATQGTRRAWIDKVIEGTAQMRRIQRIHSELWQWQEKNGWTKLDEVRARGEAATRPLKVVREECVLSWGLLHTEDAVRTLAVRQMKKGRWGTALSEQLNERL